MKFIKLLITIFLLVVLFPISVNAEKPINIYVDGEYLRLDEQPVIKDGNTLVQFRPIFEKLGLNVSWNSSTQTIKGVKEGVEISLVIGSTTATVNGVKRYMSVSPIIVNGSTFVPLRFVGEASNKEVKWYETSREIKIGQQMDSKLHIIINHEGKAGFINSAGQVIIETKFNEGDILDSFSEGVIGVKHGSLWGYLDASNQFVIELAYEEVQSFSEGLAAVKVNNKWGYIDHQNNMIIKPQFESVEEFSEGWAVVKNGNTYGYIDKKGEYLMSPTFRTAKSFSEGLAVVSNNQGEYWIIDTNGRKVAGIKDYIDLDGSIHNIIEALTRGIIEPGEFHNSIVYIGNRDNGFYMNKNGKYIGRFITFYSNQFSEGFGVAMDPVTSKYGYIDSTGKFAIQASFEKVGNFSGGLAPVQRNGKWGYINKQGDFVIQPQYKEADEFRNGLALVSMDNRVAYIDTGGNIVWTINIQNVQ